MGPRRVPECLFLALVVLAVGCAPYATAVTCKSQLEQAVGREAALESILKWIDPETPEDQCVKRLCREGYGLCKPLTRQPPKTDMYLVFSDEFNKGGRNFKAASRDAKWTAMDMYYQPAQGEEVYKPGQVTTEGGYAVVSVEKKDAEGVSQQPDGTREEVVKRFVSGMMQGFNKFCYTGGYLEASVLLPGGGVHAGLRPAIWAMGNLGRAGYMQSTEGVWPYSFSQCGDGSGGADWSTVPPQAISACMNADADDRKDAYGMEPGKGRGAPQFDVFEVRASGIGKPNTASQTLLMAPLLPPDTSWSDPGYNTGTLHPGADTSFRTRADPSKGELGRPGTKLFDSYAALSDLDSSYFQGSANKMFHKFGVDWKPGQYLRWYIDDKFLYEVNRDALISRENDAGKKVGDRLIPLEPLYIIFNVAIGQGLSAEKLDFEGIEAQLPAEMKVDWIRVYQDPKEYNVGCSPQGYPTSQYIACNREKYTAVDCDGVMITEKCNSRNVTIEECSEDARGGELATMLGTAALAFLAIGLLG